MPLCEASDLMTMCGPTQRPAGLPQNIQLEVNIINGDPTANGRDYIKPDRVIAEEQALRPYNTFSLSLTDHSFSGRLADVYQCALNGIRGVEGSMCYGHRAISDDYFGDMFLYLRDHELQFLDGDVEYEVPVFSFFVPTELKTGFGGVADDNHTDGKQMFCYIASTTFARTLAGTTSNTIHEVGHHLGAAHPHDGLDYEDFTFLSASNNATHYLWMGDESDSVMSYSMLSSNFSQFDRDIMNRWMTAVYINQANSILPKILASPRAGQVSSVLSSTDTDATSSLEKYDNMDYLNGVLKAKSAYDKVVAAAAQINITIEPNGSRSDLRSHRPVPGLIDPPLGRQRQDLPLVNDGDAGIRQVR